MEEDITHLGDTQVFLKIRKELAGLGTPVLAYLATAVVAALGIAAGLIALGQGLGNPVVVLGLAFVSAYAERGSITLRGHLTVSISLLPAIFAAVLFGPLQTGRIVGASGVSIAFPWAGRVAYMGSRAITGALAAGAVALVSGFMGGGAGQTVVAATAAALIAECADAGFAAFTYWLRGYGHWITVAKDSLPVIAASVPFSYSSAVAILVLSYLDISAWTLPLFFAPALAAQRWFLLYQEQQRLATDLQGANDQLRAANLSFAKGLIATLDARDQYTAGHSAAVAIYARDIAKRMDLGQDYADLAHLCGLVHDIGKIGLPAGLLEKPGALTLDERRDMQRHSEIGERILANVDTYAEIAAVVRHHHERVDGQGYPDRLSADEIPTLSRIIAVADAYNAMTSDPPVPRRNAEPSRQTAARAGGRNPIRHGGGCGIRGHTCRRRRGLPHGSWSDVRVGS